MQAYANPARFARLARLASPWLAAAAALTIAGGLYMAFFVAPPDYQQGETVRIMYIHVPSAWMAMACYATLALASAVALIWRHPIADVAAKETAPIGAAFTFLALVTGALWGKPMWGTYWVWDARLTSVLVLFFLYLGYMAIWAAIEEPLRAARVAAVLALVGVVNLPIIRFSVDWWNTLHQPASVIRAGGPAIHPDLLWPLFVMGVGFTLLYGALLLVRMRGEILRRRIRTLRQMQAEGAIAAS